MSASKPVYALGSKRELFVDDFFVSALSGEVCRKLHEPIPDDIVLTLDEPHELTNNAGGAYNSLIYDGKRYLYYYRAHGAFPTPARPGNNNFYLCVAESFDGINFRRCQVNLLESGYNVVLDRTNTNQLGCVSENDNVCPAVSTAFYDTNPDCPEDERYKMIVTNEHKVHGIYLFVSADGFDFRLKTGPFKLDPRCGFDSANQIFYDHDAKLYRLYSRGFIMAGPTWKRTIMTHTTRDFIHFEQASHLKFDEKFDALFARGQELYTNAIRPYFRAPHIMLGFPMRYVEGCMTPGAHTSSACERTMLRRATGNPEAEIANCEDIWNARVLSRPDLEARAYRARGQLRYGLASTDTVLIASRDGFNFKGYGESFIKPPPQEDSWSYGSGTLAIGMAVTPSSMKHGAPDEISFYCPEANWSFNTGRIRRYHLRMDGFVSLHFGVDGGELTTPHFTFDGGRLTLNISTGAFGGFKAEFRDENGAPIPGYTFEDAYEEIGDDLAMVARWKDHGPDVRPLEGKVVQLAIKAVNCDIYSICFVPYEDDPELPDISGEKKNWWEQ